MFKTLVICAVASASVAACSTARPPESAPPPTRTAIAPCPESSTASRIPMRPGQCSSSPVRAYSQQDIEGTGQTDVGTALQMLDPSISVHH